MLVYLHLADGMWYLMMEHHMIFQAKVLVIFFAFEAKLEVIWRSCQWYEEIFDFFIRVVVIHFCL